MKHNNHNESEPGFTRADLERALYHWAHRTAVALPETLENAVSALERSELADVPEPDPARFERLIQERLHGPRQSETQCNVVPLPAESPAPRGEEVEDLALAARHGKKLTAEDRRKLSEAIRRANQSRKSAPNESGSK